MDIKSIIRQLRPLLVFLFAIWFMAALTFFMPGLREHGIVPRTVSGLWGILFSPFLHSGFSHLVSNSLGFFILGLLLLSLDGKRIYLIIVMLILFSGAGTWLIGRSSAVHIGASGLIYGMLGYILLSGFFRRDVKSIVISLIVFLLYGGLIWGVFPTDKFVSWEGHLCGLVSGILLAWMLSKRH